MLPIVASARAFVTLSAGLTIVIGELGAEHHAGLGRYLRVRAIVFTGAIDAGLAYVCGSSHYRLAPFGHPGS